MSRRLVLGAAAVALLTGFLQVQWAVGDVSLDVDYVWGLWSNTGTCAAGTPPGDVLYGYALSKVCSPEDNPGLVTIFDNNGVALGSGTASRFSFYMNCSVFPPELYAQLGGTGKCDSNPGNATEFNFVGTHFCITTGWYNFDASCLTGSPTPSPRCKPSYKTTKKQCDKLIPFCRQNGTPMKWVGRGCRTNKKIAGDGGCQYEDYCGYTCKQACVKDRRCAWAGDQCFLKE